MMLLAFLASVQADTCNKICYRVQNVTDCCASINGAPCFNPTTDFGVSFEQTSNVSGRVSFFSFANNHNAVKMLEFSVAPNGNHFAGTFNSTNCGVGQPSIRARLTEQTLASGVIYLCDVANGCCLGNPCVLPTKELLTYTANALIMQSGNCNHASTRVIVNNTFSFTEFFQNSSSNSFVATAVVNSFVCGTGSAPSEEYHGPCKYAGKIATCATKCPGGAMRTEEQGAVGCQDFANTQCCLSLSQLKRDIYESHESSSNFTSLEWFLVGSAAFSTVFGLLIYCFMKEH